jgi:hypothetical protein
VCDAAGDHSSQSGSVIPHNGRHSYTVGTYTVPGRRDDQGGSRQRNRQSDPRVDLEMERWWLIFPGAEVENPDATSPSVYTAGCRNSRRAVAALQPRVAPISRKEVPPEWSLCTCSRLITFAGLPPTLPCFLALASPAMVRSLRRIRSCLAIGASIESTASLKMPQESGYCSVKLLQPTPNGALLGISCILP